MSKARDAGRLQKLFAWMPRMVQWEVSAEHESNARLQARCMSSYAHAEGLPRLNSQFPAGGLNKPCYEPLPFLYHCRWQVQEHALWMQVNPGCSAK